MIARWKYCEPGCDSPMGILLGNTPDEVCWRLAGSSRPSDFSSLKKRRPGIKRTHRAGQNGPTKSLYDFSKVMNKCDKS